MYAAPHLSDDELLSLLARDERHPHVAACPPCDERRRALAALMGAWPLPQDVPHPKVWRAIAQELRPRRRVGRLAAADAALAAVALALHAPAGMASTQHLVGTAFAPQATARVVQTADGAVFVAQGLPPTGSHQVYELWAIRGRSHIRAAVFHPDGAGRATITIPDSLLAAAYGVTLERAPGTLHPSGRRILRE